MHATSRKIVVIVGAALGALMLTSAGVAATSAGVAPQNISLPLVSGAARDGTTLQASRGQWTHSPTSYSYQWQRCASSRSSCQPIANAAGARYTITTTDVGHQLRVAVTATNRAGSRTASSRATEVVKATGSEPANTSPPSISGTFKEGNILTVAPGGWSGSPAPTFAYQWRRCNATGGGCVDLQGASATTNPAVAADVGNTLRVEVTATNSHGATRATTLETPMIAPAKAGSGTAISITQVSLPNQLIIDTPQYSRNPLRSRNAFVVHLHISDTRGFSVQGALVYALGLPYSWTENVPEATTDSTGWASITMRPSAAMPLTRGGAVVIFVRARKPGENLLSGVSARRLVQVRITP
jgi:hypothetical protein